MRTDRKMRASYSEGVVDFHFPRSWREMTQQQLRTVLGVMAASAAWQRDVLSVEVKVRCLLRLNGVRVVRRMSAARGGGWLCELRVSWRRKVAFVMQAWQMQWMAGKLAWMDDLGNMRNRLERVAGGEAVDMVMHGVPFGDYLELEKWYQMYLRTERTELLERMGHRLYLKDGEETVKPLTAAERLGVLLWWVYVKEVMARAFPNFFTRSGRSGDGGESFRENLVEQMNIQIRALTGGDVTKEETVLDRTDCWRALTELNEKAREAREAERLRKK